MRFTALLTLGAAVDSGLSYIQKRKKKDMYHSFLYVIITSDYCKKRGIPEFSFNSGHHTYVPSRTTQISLRTSRTYKRAKTRDNPPAQ